MHIQRTVRIAGDTLSDILPHNIPVDAEPRGIEGRDLVDNVAAEVVANRQKVSSLKTLIRQAEGDVVANERTRSGLQLQLAQSMWQPPYGTNPSLGAASSLPAMAFDGIAGPSFPSQQMPPPLPTQSYHQNSCLGPAAHQTAATIYQIAAVGNYSSYTDTTMMAADEFITHGRPIVFTTTNTPHVGPLPATSSTSLRLGSLQPCSITNKFAFQGYIQI